MPTSPLKRPSAGGRLGRLLASLRPPAKAGPLPVQTGFPTSLADLVVRNHGRLKNPARRRHRSSSAATAAAAAAPPLAVAAAPEPLVAQQRRELSVAAAAPVVRGKAAGFSIRPELLAAGGVVALALLVIWSKWLVSVATVASVALFWIEAARSPVPRRTAPPETKEEAPDLCVRGRASPIREAESPRSSCADSDDGNEVSSSRCSADTTTTDDSNPTSPKRKEKRRSLRKLIAKKLHNSKRPKDKDYSPGGGESKKHPDAGEAAVNVAGPVTSEPAVAAPAEQTTPAEEEKEVTAGERSRCRQVGALPLAAFVPIILVGLVAGKVPAVALTVLCAVFFSSAERVPAC